MPERRIAFLSEHASPAARRGGVDAGGQNVYVDEVSRHLGSLGYAVDVFTRRDASDAPAVLPWAPGVRIVNVPVGPPQWVFKDDLWPLMPAFRDAVRRFSLSEGRRYDLIHSNFWMSGWVAVELAQHRAPVVQIFHAMGRTKRRHQAGADTSPTDRIAVEEDVIRRADRLIAQCPGERAELVDDYGADPAKVAVIPSAVNTEIFRPVERVTARHRIGLDPDGLLIGYVGRLLPRKDIRNIIHALAYLPDLPARLMIVGGETPEPDPAATPEIGVLQRLAADLGVTDRVIFVGRQQPDALRDYYSAADIVVTTPWYEPFGLTPLEAMACGRPVIGSSVGGIPFTVVAGETGLLVPPRDPAALAAALRHLLTHPALRHNMGRAARARVEQRFTWPVVAQRTAALYEALLAGDTSSDTVAERRPYISHLSRTPVGVGCRAAPSHSQEDR